MSRSVCWYKKAAKNGNASAKICLADCYRLGKGVEKDEIKALKYYEFLAKQEISVAQCRLGDCFYHGIGTKADELLAKYWYEKATRSGNITAKHNLEKYYNKSTKIKVGNIKEIKFQKIKIRKLNFKKY
jgi:TPR repeat protein